MANKKGNKALPFGSLKTEEIEVLNVLRELLRNRRHRRAVQVSELVAKTGYGRSWIYDFVKRMKKIKFLTCSDRVGIITINVDFGNLRDQAIKANTDAVNLNDSPNLNASYNKGKVTRTSFVKQNNPPLEGVVNYNLIDQIVRFCYGRNYPPKPNVFRSYLTMLKKYDVRRLETALKICMAICQKNLDQLIFDQGNKKPSTFYPGSHRMFWHFYNVLKRVSQKIGKKANSKLASLSKDQLEELCKKRNKETEEKRLRDNPMLDPANWNDEFRNNMIEYGIKRDEQHLRDFIKQEDSHKILRKDLGEKEFQWRLLRNPPQYKPFVLEEEKKSFRDYLTLCKVNPEEIESWVVKWREVIENTRREIAESKVALEKQLREDQEELKRQSEFWLEEEKQFRKLWTEEGLSEDQIEENLLNEKTARGIRSLEDSHRLWDIQERKEKEELAEKRKEVIEELQSLLEKNWVKKQVIKDQLTYFKKHEKITSVHEFFKSRFYEMQERDIWNLSIQGWTKESIDEKLKGLKEYCESQSSRDQQQYVLSKLKPLVSFD